MAKRPDVELYIPDEQTATVLFTKKGEIDLTTGQAEEIVVMWMEVKADLTFDDRARLFWTADELPDRIGDDGEPVTDSKGKVVKDPLPDEQVWERLAPFVLDWSVGERIDGKSVPIDPPAKGGPEQFRLINPAYVAKLLADLRYRSAGNVDTSFLAR